MGKKIRKWLCVVLAVMMMASALPLVAGAIAPTTGGTQSAQSSNDGTLKVEIKSDKDRYTLLGKMEFTATITNTSSSTVENISAQALLGESLRPLANGSQFTATKASLAPNESFSFKYYADLSGLKSLDNLLLPVFWVSSLIHGGKADIGTGNGGADYIEASKAVGLVSAFSGQYDASSSVRVWFGTTTDPRLFYTSPLNDEHIAVSDKGWKYVDNELFFFAKVDVSRIEIQAIVENINGKVVGYMAHPANVYQIQFPVVKSETELENLVTYLNSLPQIEFAEINFVSEYDPDVYEVEYPNDDWNRASWDVNAPDGENWGVEFIDAPSAWVYRNDFQNVNVGVIDSKIDYAHEDLIGTEINSHSIANADSHGTHVAGIIGATFNNKIGISGVAPNSTLFGYDAGSLAGNDVIGHLVALTHLIYLNDAKVINFSRNNERTAGFAASRGNTEAIEYFKRGSFAVSYLLKNFITNGNEFLIVSAGGNNNNKLYVADNSFQYGYRQATGSDTNILSGNVDSFYNSFFNAMTDKEVRDRILVVGAIGKGEFPGVYFESAFSNKSPDVFAPGESIYSTLPNNTYGFSSGTSMATPHVSGIATMVWGANKKLKGSEVKKIILDTCMDDDLNVVNAKLAVEKALNKTTLTFASITGIALEQGTNTPLADFP